MSFFPWKGGNFHGKFLLLCKVKAEAEKLQPKEAAEAAARDVKSLVDFPWGFFGDF